MNNRSRKAHFSVIYSFESPIYFFFHACPSMRESYFMIINTVLVRTINEMYSRAALAKSPPPIVINAATILILLWYTQFKVFFFVTYFE